MTGRHFFRDVFGAESPMLAMLLMCSALSRKGEALSKMAGELTRYSHSGELRYEMPSPEAAAKAIEELAAQFRDAETEKVDGLTVRLADWWFNLRQPSGSTSLRLCVEGRSNADLRRGTMAIERAINKHLQQKPS